MDFFHVDCALPRQLWSERSTELMKGVGGRSQSAAGTAPGNPEAVLDAVFDFAEHMIEQQRAFAKQMLKAASLASSGRELPPPALSEPYVT